MSLGSLYCKEEGKGGIAVIRGASAEESTITDDWLRRAEAFFPGFLVWLFVQVAVKHHVLGLTIRRLDHIDDQWVLALALEYLTRHTLDIKSLSVIVN